MEVENPVVNVTVASVVVTVVVETLVAVPILVRVQGGKGYCSEQKL